MRAERYVTDDEYQSFRAFVPPLLQNTMDLSLHMSCGLGAILSLMWKNVHTVGVPRDRWEMVIEGVSGSKRKIVIGKEIEKTLKKCRVTEPHWPHEYVIRLEADGKRVSNKEFNLIWGLYMQRWSALPNNSFSFRDIRAKALADRQMSRGVSRRRGH